MRRCLILYGMTCVITLTLLAREIALLFGGVELALVIALGASLLLTGLGCGALGRLAAARRAGATSFALLLALTGVLAPLTLLMLRFAPALSPLQHDNFGQLLLLCFGALLPLCLANGLLLALAIIIGLRGRERAAAVAAEVAGFGAAGAFLGGLLVTCLLPDISSTQVMAGIGALHCLSAFFVWFNAPRRTELGWLLIPLVATCGLVAAPSFESVPLGPVLDFLSQTWLYPKRILRGSQETPMGRVQALAAPARTEYYLNGALVGAQGDTAAVERRTLIALLAHPDPRRLLIVAATPNDSLAAALKLPRLQIDYLPLNDDIARFAVLNAPPALLRAFDLSRIRFLWDLDPAIFLQQAGGRYDVICLELPAAAPGAFSRFMTMRFLAQARRALAEGGLLAVAVPGGAAEPDAATIRAAAALSRTLLSPSATLFAARSDSAILLLNYSLRHTPLPQPGELSSRMARLNLRGAALNEARLLRALDRRQVAQLAALLQRAQPGAPGSDQRPLPWRLAATSWARWFQGQGIGAPATLLTMDLLACFMVVLMFSGALALWGAFAAEPLRLACPIGLLCAAGAAAATAATGFLMLQGQCGVVLHEMGLVIGVGVAGAGLGALLGDRAPRREGGAGVTALLLLAQALCAALGGTAWLLIALLGPSSVYVVGLCLLLGITFAAGILLGAQLPARISAGGEPDESSAERRTLGAFAWALSGAGLAALFCGSFLVPALGPAGAALAGAFLALAPLPLMALSFRRGRWKRGDRQSSALYTGASRPARTTYPRSLR